MNEIRIARMTIELVACFCLRFARHVQSFCRYTNLKSNIEFACSFAQCKQVFSFQNCVRIGDTTERLAGMLDMEASVVGTGLSLFCMGFFVFFLHDLCHIIYQLMFPSVLGQTQSVVRGANDLTVLNVTVLSAHRCEGASLIKRQFFFASERDFVLFYSSE